MSVVGSAVGYDQPGYAAGLHASRSPEKFIGSRVGWERPRI